MMSDKSCYRFKLRHKYRSNNEIHTSRRSYHSRCHWPGQFLNSWSNNLPKRPFSNISRAVMKVSFIISWVVLYFCFSQTCCWVVFFRQCFFRSCSWSSWFRTTLEALRLFAAFRHFVFSSHCGDQHENCRTFQKMGCLTYGEDTT